MIHFKNRLTINLKEEFEKNNGKSQLKTPREHQLKANKELTNFFITENKGAGILVLPTGGGKTYTSVYWLLKNIISKNKKILWLADQGFLLEQARETFRENILETDIKRQLINILLVSGSDKHANPNNISISDDILLMTSQTAISNWDVEYETNFKKFVNENAKNGDLFIVYDEAHHTPAFGRRNFLIGGSDGKIGITEKYPKTKLLGLTATPTYTDKRQRGWLWQIFKEGIIYEISKKDLEDKKILASPVFIQEKTNFNLVLSDNDIENVVFKHQEIPSHIIEELAKNEERNDFIARYYCDNAEKFGKTLIFLDRWYQCRTIENYINRKSGKCIAASVFSYDENNRNIEYINNRTANQNEINLDKFRKGELNVLINVKMLTEGVDIPDVKTVIITRDTNSNILFTQMIGRALRGEGAGGNKMTANIVLFTDNWNRHVHFASNRLLGGVEEKVSKERGFRPFELIRLDLLDKLELEYQKQDYTKSIFDLVPIGWYVVVYVDSVEEINEDNSNEKITENFIENVIVLEQEQEIFKKFILEFNDNLRNPIWEQEELNIEFAEDLINKFLLLNEYSINNAIVAKLIQIARHLGQNNTEPEYFTFEQKADVNLLKYVVLIRENCWGRDQTEEFLENEYLRNENPFLKVIFPTYEDFYRAYEYEDNVYRKRKRGVVSISEGCQEIKVKRLASEEVRKIVFSRDGHKCLCCGKSNNLQIDHIIAFKHEEPNDDNPDLYQTLCGVCNREKNSNSYNYRVTNYQNHCMAICNVKTTPNEDPVYYFTRLINCFFKTNAVHLDSVQAKNHGASIWAAKLKLGANPQENITMKKDELINVIRKNGFRLKDVEIIEK